MSLLRCVLIHVKRFACVGELFVGIGRCTCFAPCPPHPLGAPPLPAQNRHTTRSCEACVRACEDAKVTSTQLWGWGGLFCAGQGGGRRPGDREQTSPPRRRSVLSQGISNSLIPQNPLTFCFDVFKLPAVNGPPQPTQDEKHQYNGQRNQQIQNIHQISTFAAVLGRDRRSALNTTNSELLAMPSPASQAGR